MPDELDAGGDPQLEAAPEPSPESTPAVDTWGGPSREEWDQTQTYLAQMAQAIPELYGSINGLQQPQAQQEAPVEPELDPFDPASVSAYMDFKMEQRLNAAFEENLGPFQGLLGMMASEKGEALAKQELESIRGDIGEFDQDTAYLIASGIIERGGDATQALRSAATHAHEFESKIRANEREKYQEELKRLGQAPGESVGGATSTENETIPTGPNRYQEAVDRALARRRPVMPTG